MGSMAPLQPARTLGGGIDGIAYTGSTTAPLGQPAPVTVTGAARVIGAPAQVELLDLSAAHRLYAKLDAQGSGMVEADDLTAAEALVAEGNMNTLFFALLKSADKTKSGAIMSEQWADYIDLVARTYTDMGYTQAEIDEYLGFVEFITPQKISMKRQEMMQALPQEWMPQRSMTTGMTEYKHQETGQVVNKMHQVHDKDRVKKMWKALGLEDADELTVKIVLENVGIVKQFVPEVLTDYPKMDKDANLKLSKKEVEEYINPSLKAEYTLKELETIWNVFLSTKASGDPDIITMEDVGNQIEYVKSNIPELMDEYLNICYGKSCSMKKDDFMTYFAAADLWLEQRLKHIIGLSDLKKQVTSFYWGVRLNRLRRTGGHDVYSDEAIVLMFKGNPGVGKTTIGRIITKLLYKIDIISTDKFFEVQRDQMVGAALGQTEEKTQKLIDDARGGVLFVDEAYRLSSDQFGKEAVNCLMRAMTVKGNVIIVAGYPNEMEEWTLLNPGIKRRITYEFVFPNYTLGELAQILHGMIKKQGFQCEVPTNQIETLLRKYTSGPQLENFNGGVCEHIVRHAVEKLNRREIGAVQEAARNSLKPPTPSVLLTLQDLEHGCTKIPKVGPKS